MNNIQSISRVNQSPAMFDEPSDYKATNIFDCFQEEKIQPPFSTNTGKQPLTPKLHKKRTKISCNHSEEKCRKSKESGSRNPNKSFGHWSLQENKRYHWFLQIRHHHFLNKYMRRMDRIFKTMASFVGSREAEQCRSHHQKMEKKFDHSFCKILLFLREQHYASKCTLVLEEEILKNRIDVGSGLLSEEFLLQSSQGQQKGDLDLGLKEGENEGSLEYQKEFLIDQGQNSNLQQDQLPQIYPIDLSKSLVDSLFEDDAPHNNFSMI